VSGFSFDQFKIGLAQINPVVGDVHGNIAQIEGAAKALDARGADIAIFSELVVTGYPPEDLILKPSFIDASMDAVHDLAHRCAELQCGVLVSSPWREDGRLYNAAILLHQGEIVAKRYKVELPNYGVFDEKRVFEAGNLPEPVMFKGRALGVMSCEDMWFPRVSAHLAGQGAEVLLCLNASPFDHGKYSARDEMARSRASETGLPLVYVNQVGGQDEIVFDGRSFVMDAQGAVIAQAPAFQDYIGLMQDLPAQDAPSDDSLFYQAMVTGLRDYVEKNGFPGVLLGLSGGIDSAISAVLAVDALGAERVQCVMMPSRYTSQDSLDDAKALADNLGVQLDTIGISDVVEAYHKVLPADAPSIMFENLQSRSRGVILMGLSNANGKMLLSTGNKSEMAVGYATIYGDMCGGFNALKDLYKTQVFALCRWRNAQEGGAVIPERIITKPPTAELRDNQTDQDSLPPYDVLDGILSCLIEGEMPLDDVIAQRGYSAEDVYKVERLLTRAEYKRRQSPPGVKLTARAFGRERRYPITNRFVENSHKR
tara:strand:+ start:1020 stop:2639 length:1620 start_codon:yes stop_codon:yes gene_type:complete